ncbi:hypothetical protein PsYK624_077720 [Phanerochaete sordida]|uniref:Uncharacterized protein n=1 Tax=Phanerochaete sordida TaxID=48140 RepID=A0A9P3GBK3_9APHY|nr:hypothetical protein PsYK624_077720 [Phanerochaete sordida]
MTWKKAYHRQQDVKLVNLRSSASLTQTILRDGTAYFIAMILVNIAEVLTITHGPSTAFAGPFLDALPPIIVCRFIMNLRRSFAHSGYTEDSETVLDSPGAMQTVSLVFRQFHRGLDDFGRSLDVGDGASQTSSVDSMRSRGASVLSDETTDEDLAGERGIGLMELRRNRTAASPSS